MRDSILHQEKDPSELCSECGGKGYIVLFTNKEPCSKCNDTVYFDGKLMINLAKEIFEK